MVMMRRIASANELNLPPIDLTPCFAWLSTNSGYLTPARGFQPDPAVTVDAARLGRPAPPELVETVLRTATPSGWGSLPPAFSTTPEKTYRGLAVARALGSTEYDEPVRRGTEVWLAALATTVESAEKLEPELRQSLFVVALANEAGVPLPPEIRERFRILLDDPALLSWDLSDQAKAVRMALLMDLPVPDVLAADFYATAEHALAAEPTEYIGVVPLLLTVAEVRPSADLRQRIDAELAKFDLGGGLFAVSVDGRTPSLRSTVIGLSATQRLATEGPPAVRRFRNEEGTWSAPPTEVTDANVNIETTYLGMVLDGRIPLETWPD